MNGLSRIARRIWYCLNRRRLERELDREMAGHRATMTEPNRFGSAVRLREQSADVWGWTWMDDLAHDVRFGARLLLKDRRSTLAAIVALALGLGATTTAFTFVNGAIFRDLPLADADRIVWMRTVDTRGRQLGVSFADARDWRESTRMLSHVVVSLELPINLVEDTLAPQRYYGSFISADAFVMVGRAPILGRGFLPDDDRAGAPRVAIIANTVWRNRYGSDPAVIGRAVRVNDVPATIVGVMPERFHFPSATEVWVPLTQVSGPPETIEARRGNRAPLYLAIGRLADGVGIAQAQAEMDTITARLAREHPATNGGISIALDPLERIYRGDIQRMSLLLMGAVTCVLLVACVNVGNLQLARAVQRSREIAIRSHLGATHGRIIRQLFVESALMAVAAGALGFLLSLYGVRTLASAISRQIPDGPAPFWLDFPIDLRVYGLLAAACLGASLLFGLAPAVRVSKIGNEVLKDGARGAIGGRRHRRWAGTLIVAQLALTLVLLAGAGLMVRSFLAVAEAGRVLDTSNVMTMQVALSAQKYPQPAQIKQFFAQLDERLASVPTFSAVTIASDIPMRTVINAQRQLTIAGRPAGPDDTDEKPASVAYLYVGPRYFDTLRLRLLKGREFTEQDGAPGQETAIVNQRFASMFFPAGDPIGHRIRLANATAPNIPQPWFTIVGVVPTIPQIVVREPEPVVYVPVRGEPAPHRFVSVIARAQGDRASVVSTLRDEVRKVDPNQPGYFFQTLDEVLSMSRWQYRVFGIVFALLAGIALVLAAVGLYAVTAHGVTQRTQEIGIRVALGAHAPQVVWLFVRRTIVHLVAGVLIGLGGAVVVGRLLASYRGDPYAETLLVKTTPTDPLVLGAVSALLVAVATLASVWPARRAARVDPAIALRAE